jgi:hypothetical protein
MAWRNFGDSASSRGQPRTSQGDRGNTRRRLNDLGDNNMDHSDEDTVEIGQELMKLSISSMSRCRNLSGIVEHFAMIPKKDPLIVLMEAEGLKYYNATKGKPNHGHGAPHLAKGFALLEHLLTRTFDEKYKPTLEGLRPLVASLQDADRTEVEDIVRQCFVADARTKPNEEALTKILYHYEGILQIGQPVVMVTLNQAVSRLLRALGATTKGGAPPPGASERTIRKQLTKLLGPATRRRQ